MIRKPNFFCIGAQKAGTTTLYEILKKHPEIFLPSKKELHFFDTNKYEKGLKWYLKNYFNTVQDEIAIGEITPSYCFIDEVPKKIYSTLGSKIRFIFILRNPLERAISHFNMMKAFGKEKLSFEEALIAEQKRKCRKDFSNFAYIGRGYYSEQLKNFMKYYDVSKFLLLSFEKDIKVNHEKTIRKIEIFLELKSKIDLEKAIHAHPSNIKSKNIHLALIKNFINTNIPFINTKFTKEIYKAINPTIKIKKFDLAPNVKKKYFEKYFAEEFVEINKITNNKFLHWMY